jgi:hypothetical protein
LACCAGEPVGQSQPEEREGGASPGDQGRAREVVGLEANRRKKKGGAKEEGKKKREKREKEKEKREKGNKKKENKRRKIEKRFRKLGEICRKIRREVKKDFADFPGFSALISGTAVMARRTGRQVRGGAGFPSWWPTAALGRHAWAMARVRAVPAGFAARAPRVRENDRGFERG